jgi:L-lactate utilization protein LutB
METFRAVNQSEMIIAFQREIDSLGGRGYVASSHANVSKMVADIATRTDSKVTVKQSQLIQGEEVVKELERRGVM